MLRYIQNSFLNNSDDNSGLGWELLGHHDVEFEPKTFTRSFLSCWKVVGGNMPANGHNHFHGIQSVPDFGAGNAA